MQKITPHLWFDNNAEEAAKFYTSIFKNSKIKNVTMLHNTPAGTVEIFTVELMGQEFTLINAGPLFKFNPSVSFLVLPMCDGRISHYSIRKKSFII
jgi:predicted 3-demethylubiquinone-9 3-methyltransferase (glyoxalase superfamily)